MCKCGDNVENAKKGRFGEHRYGRESRTQYGTGVLNLTGCYSQNMFQSACYHGARYADEGERESLLSLRVASTRRKETRKNVGACYTLRGSKAVDGNDKVRKRCGV